MNRGTARGDGKSHQGTATGLFADRTSTGWLRSNQLRLYFSTFARQLLQALWRLGLCGMEMAQAQFQTNRLKLLKMGAQICLPVRRVALSLASGHAFGELFTRIRHPVGRS